MLDADLWTDIRPALEAATRIQEADTTSDTSIQKIAERAVEALNDPTFVLGFSMGGYVAREIAYQAPQRVKGLILVATSARSSGQPSTSRQQTPVDELAFRRLSRAAVSRSLHPGHQTDKIIGRVQDMSERLGPDVFVRQSRLNRAGDAQRLGEIRCPTLIVAAAQDRLRSLEESRELQTGIAGSSLEIIEESGHLVPLERPDQLARLVIAFCQAHD